MDHLQAISSSRSVTQWLAVPRYGHILATFARSCYLDVAGRIIAIVDADLLNGPVNVTVDARGVEFSQIPIGTTVEASGLCLRIHDGPEVDLTHAFTWEPRLPQWTHVDWAGVRARLPSLVSLVRSRAPEHSFAGYLRDVTSVPQRARHALSLFGDGLTARSIHVVAYAAGQLAGLGSGLTPSGDDVLVGALVALTVSPDNGHHGFRETILDCALGRTTRISEAYLEAAARGEAGEAWHRFVQALSGLDVSAIASAVQRVMAFGETSGADMLTGFVLATQAIIESRQ